MIVPLVIDDGLSETDGTEFTTRTLNPTPNRVWLLSALTAYPTTTASTPTISGCSLAWGVIGDAPFTAASRLRRLSVYLGSGTPTAGNLTITCSTSASGAIWTVIELIEVDLANANVTLFLESGNYFTSGSDTPASSRSVSLPRLGPEGNRGFAVFAHAASEAATPAAGFDKLSDRTIADPATGMMVCWRPDAYDNSPSASWATSAAYADFAVELDWATPVSQVGFFGAAGGGLL